MSFGEMALKRIMLALIIGFVSLGVMAQSPNDIVQGVALRGATCVGQTLAQCER